MIIRHDIVFHAWFKTSPFSLQGGRGIVGRAPHPPFFLIIL
jgi:hypothetical protein